MNSIRSRDQRSLPSPSQPPQQLTHLPGPSPFAAFELPDSCAQDVEQQPALFINDPYPYRVSEDCLYVNIYTPAVVGFWAKSG